MTNQQHFAEEEFLEIQEDNSAITAGKQVGIGLLFEHSRLVVKKFGFDRETSQLQYYNVVQNRWFLTQ